MKTKLKIKKQILALCLSAALCMPQIQAFAQEPDENGEQISSINMSLFKRDRRLVLVKYIAMENNCSIKSDASQKSVSVFDKNGNLLKTFGNVAFFYGEPIMDAGILEESFGWTAVKHLPSIEMFDREIDAAIAGGATYLKQSENTELTFYVGRCYFGYYFEPKEGDHAAEVAHKHEVNSDMFYEKPVVMKNGVIKSENADVGFEDAVSKSVLDESLHPVFLDYIALKNDCSIKYNAVDKSVSFYDSNGEHLVKFKNVPYYNGKLTIDKGVLTRALDMRFYEHEADTDLFNNENDAIYAGFLTYFNESKDNSITFYVGNCYQGYYFSKSKGAHSKAHEHKHNQGIFSERQIEINNGFLVYDEAESADKQHSSLVNYADNSKRVTIEKPSNALTKMVTVIHTEYDKAEGVQSIYFSYRDRVYRDYWEDLAGYDVTDYVFIPPNIGEGTTNENMAEPMAKAIKSLLAKRPDAKIWVGTPGITSENFSNEAITAEGIVGFLEMMRARLGNSVWNENVVGAYINQESVYTDDYKFQIDRIQQIVKGFKSTNHSKKTLWIPYYDLSVGMKDVSEKISHVSRLPDLFDYIIIQPGYFFFDKKADGTQDPDTTEHRKPNIIAVELSSQKNYLVDSLGEPIIGNTSQTQIGFEMEPQASYFSNSRATRDESLDRYTDYLRAGAKIKETAPMAFYTSGDPHCNKECLVYKFYSADELSSETVKKKLDESLNSYFDYVAETREYDKVFMEYAKSLYLAKKPGATEEEFASVYKPEVVLLEFYKYEKTNKIDNLADYISENNKLPEFFDNTILGLL